MDESQREDLARSRRRQPRDDPLANARESPIGNKDISMPVSADDFYDTRVFYLELV